VVSINIYIVICTSGSIFYMSILPSFAHLSLHLDVNSTREKKSEGADIAKPLHGAGGRQPTVGPRTKKDTYFLNGFDIPRPQYDVRPIAKVHPDSSTFSRGSKRPFPKAVTSKQPQTNSQKTLLLLQAIEAKQLIRAIELNVSTPLDTSQFELDILKSLGFKKLDDGKYTLQAAKIKEFVELYETRRLKSFNAFVQQHLRDLYNARATNDDNHVKKEDQKEEYVHPSTSKAHSGKQDGTHENPFELSSDESDADNESDEYVLKLGDSPFQRTSTLEDFHNAVLETQSDQSVKSDYYSKYDKKNQTKQMSEYKNTHLSNYLQKGKPKKDVIKPRIKNILNKLTLAIKTAEELYKIKNWAPYQWQEWSTFNAYEEYLEMKNSIYEQCVVQMEADETKQSVFKFIPTSDDEQYMKNLEEKIQRELTHWISMQT